MGAGTVLSIAKGAKEAQRELARAGGAKREAALREISSALRENVQSILEANRADIAAARENGMLESMIARLPLTAERIAGRAKGIADVAAMPPTANRPTQSPLTTPPRRPTPSAESSPDRQDRTGSE